MESTGKAGMIQISSSTADLLIEAGKSHWLKEREDKVNAKGKGELTTFWLLPLNNGRKNERRNDSTHTLSDSVSLGEDIVTHTSNIKNSNLERIVTWVVDGLSQILKDIARQRVTSQQEQHVPYDKTLQTLESELTQNANDHSVLRVVNEVKEVIDFSGVEYVATCHDDTSHSEESTCLDEDIIHQLSQYIHVIATTYQSNAFHNFDHASHVTMSVMKMLSRIVQPKLKTTTGSSCSTSSEKTMNNRICQIVSDPLTRFACIFSAIIHDCDHYGMSQKPF
jgi:3'5'-cyclic nucleotide phosphodiesterase/Adenylate and Guanylate cyclase catalytic domain